MAEALGLQLLQEVVHVGRPRLSPDGLLGAVEVARPAGDGYSREVLVVRVDDGVPVAFLENAMEPRWSPHGLLAFLGSKSRPGVYMATPGGEPRLVVEVEEARALGWVGRRMLGFVVSGDGAPCDRVVELMEPRDRLVVVDSWSGRAVWCSEPGGRITSWAAAHHAPLLAVSRSPPGKPWLSEVVVVDLESGEQKTVVPASAGYSFSAVSWSFDDSHLLLKGFEASRGPWAHHQVFVFDFCSEKLECLTCPLGLNTEPHPDTDTLGPLEHGPYEPCLPGNGWVYFAVSAGGSVALYRARSKGEYEPVIPPGGVLHGFSVDSRGDRVLYVKSSLAHLSDAWVWEEGGVSWRVTRFNELLERRLCLDGLSRLTFRARDGVELEGWWLGPRGRPVVVAVHGGPKAFYGATPSLLHRVLASRYRVVYCNYRGSDGYSEDFASPQRPGTRDVEDLLDLLDAISSVEGVNSSRVALVGFGYGAYLAVLAASRRRVAAVVAVDGVYDWVSEYSMGFTERWALEKLFGGPPSKLMREYVEASPALSPPSQLPPVLLVHSEGASYSVDHSVKLYVALKSSGVKVKLVVFKEGYWSSPRLASRLAELVLEWLEEHLEPRPILVRVRG